VTGELRLGNPRAAADEVIWPAVALARLAGVG